MMNVLLLLFVQWLFAPSPPPPAPPIPTTLPTSLLIHEEKDPSTGRLLKSWTCFPSKYGDVKEGYEKTFSEKGAVIVETPYHLGQIDGHLRRYSEPDGEYPVADERWVRGHRDGPQFEWNLVGQLHSETDFQNGQPTQRVETWELHVAHETLTTFDKQGNKTETTDFLDHKKAFHATYSAPPWPGGAPTYDGEVTWWDTKDGHVLIQGTWKKGKPFDGICGSPVQHGSMAWLEFSEYKDGKLIRKVEPNPLYSTTQPATQPVRP